MSDARTTDRQLWKAGARLKRRMIGALPAAETLPTPPSSVRGDAYNLAVASKHKPWARRWLRANRCWL